MSSCQSPVGKSEPIATPCPTATVTLVPKHVDVTPVLATGVATIPLPVSLATIWSYPTPMNVFDYPDQVTDGELLFSIEEVDQVCHKLGKPIEIRLLFNNLTTETIKIIDQFLIAHNRFGAGGNVIPFVSTLNGERLFTPLDYTIIDSVHPQVDDYLTIPAHQSLKIVVDYYFPGIFQDSSSTETNHLVIPAAGWYLIRFVYVHPERDIDAWQGGIGSNKIEICIVR